MNKKNIKIIIKKEITSYLHNPAAYIVLVVFLLLWEYLFFKGVFLVGSSSLRSLYDFFPWLMLILVPAVTMGTLAKEKDDGTLELLLTHPVREAEVIIGKFVGSLMFVLCALLFSIPIAISLNMYGSLDWGVVAGQILGSTFFAAALVSLGVFASSLFSSQIAALLVTVAGGFLFILIGTEFVNMSLPLELGPILERLSLTSHLVSVSRGVIDTRDILYFASFVLVFLRLTHLQLLKRKYGNRRVKYVQYQLGTAIFIGVVLLVNMVGDRIPGRLDLTKNDIYTLSGTTKEIVGNLEEPVTITLYASSQLPAQYSPLLREVKDTLNDYANASKGNVVVVIKDPSRNPELGQEAEAAGVRMIQFNVVGQEEFQVKTGYFGLEVSFGEESESMPFIQSADDLEYQLTTFIWKLAAADKKTVAFLQGHGEKGLLIDYRILNSELFKQFDIGEVKLDFEAEGGETEIDPEVDVLIIPGPTSKLDEDTQASIKRFLGMGKNVFLMADSYVISPELQHASVNASDAGALFSEIGIKVENNLIYDLQSQDTLRFGDGVVSYMLPYPLWVRALPGEEFSSVTHKVNYVSIPWGSSLSLSVPEGYKVTNLLSTTQFGGANSEFSIDPSQEFSRENLGQFVMAAAVEAPLDQAAPFGKMVIVGDSDFLSDGFIQNSPQNLMFGINAISWLSGDISFADIRIKAFDFGQFTFTSEDQPQKIKVYNMAAAFLVPVVFGGAILLRRKSLGKKKYS
ncbi:Gldg family protein [bacterium]|nr:Gldg family protein [bacterium]